MKLLANRPALVSNAISGFGTVGNDIIGKGLPFYNDSLPQRAQDISAGESLCSRRRASRTCTWCSRRRRSSRASSNRRRSTRSRRLRPGSPSSFSRSLPDSYFNPSLQYLKLLFGQSQWPVFSLKFFYLQALAKNAPYNETHWNDPAWNTLLFKAIGELDQSKAQSYWDQVQKIQYEQGGYMCWTNADYVDGVSKNVQRPEAKPRRDSR